MRNYLKIANQVEENESILRKNLNKSFGKDGNSLLIPLLYIERILQGMSTLAKQSNKLEEHIVDDSGNIDMDWYRFDNPEYVESRNCDYFFFCCVKRLYSELRLINKYIKSFSEETKILVEKLEPFKNIRDGLEHRDEEYWKMDRGENINIINQLRKGGRLDFPDSDDFPTIDEIMETINEIYDFFLDKLGIPLDE